MKKILSFILFALLLLPLEGQGILRANPFYSASKRTYLTVLNDGDTWAWYKADADNITTDGQDSVTVWNNALGDAPDLTNGTNTKRKPVFHGASVIFDGTNSVLFYLTTVLAQPITIYMVLNQLAAPLGFEDGNRIIGGTSVYLTQWLSSPKITAYAGSSGSSIAGPAIGTRGLVTLILDGDNGYLQTNDDTPAADATYGTNSFTGLFVGSNEYTIPSAMASNISVSEIIIRSINDSVDDMALIKAYLQNKYGL
jgi:hypothetical protein